MSPEQIAAATEQLVTAVNTGAVADGQAIQVASNQLAPGLATGTNMQGGLNYQRYVQPQIATLANPIVTQTKQAVLKQALKDNKNAAQVGLEEAQLGYRLRQRQFQRQQAIENEKQRQESMRLARQASSGYGASSGVSGGSAGAGVANVGGVKVTAAAAPKTPTVVAKKNGYNFFDANGKPITWQTYERLTGQSVKDLVSKSGGGGGGGGW